MSRPQKVNRTHKSIKIDSAVLDAFYSRQEEGILPVSVLFSSPSQALEVLLAGYAAGTLTVAPQPQPRGVARGDVNLAVHQSVLDAALDDAGRRPRGGEARSLSGLCELLLAGYVSGAITITVTATGHVPFQGIKPQDG